MSEIVLEFISEFVQGLLLAFLPVLASMASAWVFAKAKSAWLAYKESHTDSWAVEQVARIAVRAAEQANLGGLIKDKKDYAVAIAQEWLNEKGLNITLDLIEAAIEAAVYQEFNKAENS